MAACQLPGVIVNMMRGGPGLGNISPAQGDYFQATKGGGHGDYHLIVLAPASVQEMADFVYDGFDLADKYRNPVMVCADGMIGPGKGIDTNYYHVICANVLGGCSSSFTWNDSNRLRRSSRSASCPMLAQVSV